MNRLSYVACQSRRRPPRPTEATTMATSSQNTGSGIRPIPGWPSHWASCSTASHSCWRNCAMSSKRSLIFGQIGILKWVILKIMLIIEYRKKFPPPTKVNPIQPPQQGCWSPSGSLYWQCRIEVEFWVFELGPPRPKGKKHNGGKKPFWFFITIPWKY